MVKETPQHAARVIACLFLCLVAIGCDSGIHNKTEQSIALNQTTQAASQSKTWHEGGTLHKATALEWQAAQYNNKLATCADFIARMHNNKHLIKDVSFKIKSIDDMRPLAEELVAGLDEAFEKNPDPSENERMFADQKVTSATVMVVAAKGWISY